MTLESSSKVYKIINLVRKSNDYRVYRCLRSTKYYLLYRIVNEPLKQTVCLCFTQPGISDFDGFCEMFTNGDDLILVFREAVLEETAADYSDESTNEVEKLAFFDMLLTALCVHNVPVRLAYDLILHDNIGVTAQGGADCRYDLYELGSYENSGDDINRLSELFSDKLSTAFAKLPRSKCTGKVTAFCVQLSDTHPKSIMELYERYNLFKEDLTVLKIGETKRERIKRISKKAFVAAKAVLTAVLLALAVYVLLLSVFNAKPGSGGIYDRIGDVSIEEFSS